MALIEKLEAIGDAIRAKTGGTELLTLDDMPVEIAAIETGGGGADVEPIVLSGESTYACAGKIAGEFIKLYGNKVSTNDITGAANMFYNSELETIPFALNFKQSSKANLGSLFENCRQLKEIPNINNAYPNGISKLFSNCQNIRYLPEDLGSNWNWNELHTYNYANAANVFEYCYSLRKIPEYFLSNLWGVQTSATYMAYRYAFYYCVSLDEINNIPVHQVTLTSNGFSYMFYYCYRVKDITFATNEDGTPKTANWKSQTIDLTQYVGSVYNKDNMINYNSGITVDKQVSDDIKYQNLKNNPDWWAGSPKYSRYNHDSAVATINSLPDTSAYLASAGGTNTIKFKGEAGSGTDGGAINTLTAEEIAVAAAKGWTVTLV